jgi:hypothetical protein
VAQTLAQAASREVRAPGGPQPEAAASGGGAPGEGDVVDAEFEDTSDQQRKKAS